MASPAQYLLVTTHWRAHTHTIGTLSTLPGCWHLGLVAPFNPFAPDQWLALRPPYTHVHTEQRAPHPEKQSGTEINKKQPWGKPGQGAPVSLLWFLECPHLPLSLCVCDEPLITQPNHF